METIYILRLENDCWYVGKTSDLATRIAQHAAGNGSAWTRLHRPLREPPHKLESVRREDATGRETKITAHLMIQKGVNRVRGAQFCKTQPFGPDDLGNLANAIGHALEWPYKVVAELISPHLEANMETVYVLRLENDCWYVGKTSDLATRIAQHAAGNGSAWTRLHRPLREPPHRMESVSRQDATGRETKITALLMIEKGVNRVRGGQFSETRPFGPADLGILATTIGHALELAYKDVAKRISPDLRMNMSPSARHCGMSSPPTCTAAKPSSGCFRCGRTSHSAKDCFARTHVSGAEIVDSSMESDSSEAEDESETEEGCYRCGRMGHWAANCYARRAVDGTPL